MHLNRQWTCWSLRCSWSITRWRCSNYIFILDFTTGFNGLDNDNCKMRQESLKFWEAVPLENIRNFTVMIVSNIPGHTCHQGLRLSPNWWRLQGLQMAHWNGSQTQAESSLIARFMGVIWGRQPHELCYLGWFQFWLHDLERWFLFSSMKELGVIQSAVALELCISFSVHQQ